MRKCLFSFHHYYRRNSIHIKSSRSESKEMKRRGMPASENELHSCVPYVYLKYANCMSWEKKGGKIWLNQWKAILTMKITWFEWKTHSRSWINTEWNQRINLSWSYVGLIQRIFFFQLISKSLKAYKHQFLRHSSLGGSVYRNFQFINYNFWIYYQFFPNGLT